jgi:hypothetical protein
MASSAQSANPFLAGRGYHGGGGSSSRSATNSRQHSTQSNQSNQSNAFFSAGSTSRGVVDYAAGAGAGASTNTFLSRNRMNAFFVDPLATNVTASSASASSSSSTHQPESTACEFPELTRPTTKSSQPHKPVVPAQVPVPSVFLYKNALVATIDDKMRDEQARMHRLQYREFELRGKIYEKIQSDAARSAAATAAAAFAAAGPITADEYDAVINKIKF